MARVTGVVARALVFVDLTVRLHRFIRSFEGSRDSEVEPSTDCSASAETLVVVGSSDISESFNRAFFPVFGSSDFLLLDFDLEAFSDISGGFSVCICGRDFRGFEELAGTDTFSDPFLILSDVTGLSELGVGVGSVNSLGSIAKLAGKDVRLSTFGFRPFVFLTIPAANVDCSMLILALVAAMLSTLPFGLIVNNLLTVSACVKVFLTGTVSCSGSCCLLGSGTTDTEILMPLAAVDVISFFFKVSIVGVVVVADVFVIITELSTVAGSESLNKHDSADFMGDNCFCIGVFNGFCCAVDCVRLADSLESALLESNIFRRLAIFRSTVRKMKRINLRTPLTMQATHLLPPRAALVCCVEQMEVPFYFVCFCSLSSAVPCA